MELQRELRRRLRSLSCEVVFEQQRQMGECAVLASSGSNNKKQHLALPRTVQEFLSRDPLQVAKDLNVSVSQVRELRVDFAQEFLRLHSGGQQHVSDIITTASAKQLVLFRNETGHDANTTGEAEYDNSIVSLQQPPPLFAGAVTALDYCIYQSYRSSKRQRRTNSMICGADIQASPALATLVVSTGSLALDRLISSRLDRGRVCPWMDWLSTVVKTNETTSLEWQMEADDIHGLEFGYVTEVVGTSSTGKTQMALSLACHAASVGGMDVTYLVSGGASIISLSRRASKIIAACRNNNSIRDDSSIMDSLERIHFISVTDGFSVLATLTQLENENNRRLIICDSAQGFLTANLLGTHDKGGGGGAGSGFVSEVSMALRRHARKTGNAIFVTNGMVAAANNKGGQMTSSFKNGLQPALGAEWRASDVRISLNVVDDGDLKRINATLLRHYSKQVHKMDTPTVMFGISAAGIIDVTN
jgi:RecA/RadA recombinase